MSSLQAAKQIDKDRTPRWTGARQYVALAAYLGSIYLAWRGNRDILAAQETVDLAIAYSKSAAGAGAMIGIGVLSDARVTRTFATKAVLVAGLASVPINMAWNSIEDWSDKYSANVREQRREEFARISALPTLHPYHVVKKIEVTAAQEACPTHRLMGAKVGGEINPNTGKLVPYTWNGIEYSVRCP